MSSKSFAEPLGAWLETRMPVARFGAVALVLTAGAAAAGTPQLSWAPGAFATAVLLVFQFRLWDDLADAARDAIEHPDRTLPRAPSKHVFRWAACAAFAGNVLALSALNGAVAAGGLVALTLCYGAWYALDAAHRTGLAGAHFLVAKYAAFSLLLAPAPLEPARAALACAAVYLTFSAHELWHDPRHSARPLARKLFALELGALALVLVYATTSTLAPGEAS